MTIPASWIHRLRALEEGRRAAVKASRPAREITDDMTLAEIQNEWQLTLEESNAAFTDQTLPADAPCYSTPST
jgi:hypothetical protein